MNVYVYKGTDRTSAIKPLIKDNKQASEYYLYKAPIDEGILIVAYPEKDKTTELAFEFWVGYSPEDDKAEEEEDDLSLKGINKEEDDMIEKILTKFLVGTEATFLEDVNILLMVKALSAKISVDDLKSLRMFDLNTIQDSLVKFIN